MDYAEARQRMVDGQIRPNKVSDPRIIDAMRELPREAFLPANLQSRAYTDEDIALGNGRVLMEPMILARLLQIASVRTGDRMLIVASGTGYGAAVAARLGATVTALEQDAGLAGIARSALTAAGIGDVRLVQGELTAGHAAGGPFDVILIEGEVPEIPAAIAGQLAEGGRLVTVLPTAGRSDRAVIGLKVGGALSVTDAFDCATTPLPAFRRESGFVF